MDLDAAIAQLRELLRHAKRTRPDVAGSARRRWGKAVVITSLDEEALAAVLRELAPLKPKPLLRTVRPKAGKLVKRPKRVSR
jgi:hypothetical protein